MVYANLKDMIDRFGDLEVLQISDRKHTGEIDEEVVAVALQDASAEIDAYLGRFKKPFDETPPILKRLCCDITRYRLTATSGVLITEEIRNRYRIDVLELLKALASGQVQLGSDSEGQEISSDASIIQFVNSKNRIFSRDNEN